MEKNLAQRNFLMYRARLVRIESPPHRWSEHLYVERDRSGIALFKFILESLDNLAYLSVLDKYRAMVRLTFSPDGATTLHALMHDLATTGEVAIRNIM